MVRGLRGRVPLWLRPGRLRECTYPYHSLRYRVRRADSVRTLRRLQRSRTESAIPGYQSVQRPQVTKTLAKTASDGSGAGPSEALPVYSYKDYERPACVVYTKNEEEVNDLVGCLYG